MDKRNHNAAFWGNLILAGIMFTHNEPILGWVFFALAILIVILETYYNE